jgi:beta-aspartyl-peptidase (threonine type)
MGEDRAKICLKVRSGEKPVPDQNTSKNNPNQFSKVVLAVHGGAGVINRENMTGEMETEHRAGLEAALKAGFAVAKAGGNSLDIVEAAVRTLEDCPAFNAGCGSVFTHEGKIEMDAAIMDGKSLKAGAIASVTNIRNPITAARAVMEKTAHVFLVGKGAEEFAAGAGLPIVDPSYFWTERQWSKLQRILKEDSEKAQANSKNETSKCAESSDAATCSEMKKYGTVGAVAVDAQGNLAAATSTGGTMNKQFGRVGDSPLIGSGTYADNGTCAISTTGHGEYFIRYVAAYEVCALMKYKQLPLAEAAAHVIHEVLMPVNGRGGLIALDASGNCALPFNSEGMFRGCIETDGTLHVAIYGS